MHQREDKMNFENLFLLDEKDATPEELKRSEKDHLGPF